MTIVATLLLISLLNWRSGKSSVRFLPDGRLATTRPLLYLDYRYYLPFSLLESLSSRRKFIEVVIE